MEMQLQPNPWSCTIASLAMCLDLPVSALIHMLGHDGSGIIRKPDGRCGVHMQEIYTLAYNLGYAFIPFERKRESDDGQTIIRLPVGASWWKQLMNGRVGIITGERRTRRAGHAVAWDGTQVFDPCGLTYDLRFSKNYNFLPMTFHIRTNMIRK